MGKQLFLPGEGLGTGAYSKEVLDGSLDMGFGIFYARSDQPRYIKVGESSMRYFISDQHPLWKKKQLNKEDLYGHQVAWAENESADFY